MKTIKSFKLAVIMVAALATMPLIQGCALLLLGGVAAGCGVWHGEVCQ